MLKDERFVQASIINERVHRIISVILVSLMMASVGFTVSQFINQLFPDWNSSYLVAIGFVISLEGFFSHRYLKKLSTLSREWIVLISTQLVVSLIVIKLMVSLSNGVGNLLLEIPRWRTSFFEVFFAADFLFASVFAIMIWLIAGFLTELLDEMGLDSALISREVISSNLQEKTPPKQRLMAAVFAIGGVLMFITAAARVDTRALFANDPEIFRELSSLEAGGVGTLLYFLFGFMLLSQAQFITLNTRWFLQGVPVSRFMTQKWAQYSFIFLFLIVLIVSVLPTNYSLGLLSVLGYLFDILMGIVLLVFGVILAIVSFLFSLPFILLGMDEPVNIPEFVVTPIATPPPEMIPDSMPFPWLDLLKSFLFWSVFLIVIGYSIAQYLRQHEEILEGLKKLPGSKFISMFWHWLQRLFLGINKKMTGIVKAGRTRLTPRSTPGRIRRFRRLTGFGRLSSRQKIFFYYGALLKRGDETGLPRKDSQSPEEYAEELERSLITVEDEITLLTDVFSEARYSNHAIEEDSVNQVKKYWERIRSVFRGRRG
jgi:hypothetical protein